MNNNSQKNGHHWEMELFHLPNDEEIRLGDEVAPVSNNKVILQWMG